MPMSKIFTFYFIVNTTSQRKKQIGLFQNHSLPFKGIKVFDEELQVNPVYDVRDEVIKNILDFSIAYRNSKKD